VLEKLKILKLFLKLKFDFFKNKALKDKIKKMHFFKKILVNVFTKLFLVKEHFFQT